MGQLTPQQQAQQRNNGQQANRPLGQPASPYVDNHIKGNPMPPPPVPQYSPTNLPNIGSQVPFQKPQLPPTTAFGGGQNFQDPGASSGVQPIAFNGGYYNPTTAPFGFDQSTPGVREQFWANNQNLWFQDPQLDWVDAQQSKFEDPWQGEQKVSDIMGTIANPGAGQQYWTGVQGQFNQMGNDVMGGYGGPNNAQEAYGMTKGMLPGSLQPQFDKYYDRMKDKVMSDVDSQSAARGAYGSNSALNNSIGAGLDVEAQRAKAATDFSLQDSQNQMAWQGLLGSQARGADLSGLGIYGSKLQGAQFGLDKTRLGGELAFKAEGMDLDKKKTQADLAFGLDEHELSRLGAGVSTAFGSSDRHQKALNDAYDASGKAQDAFENRTNNLYGNVAQFSNDVQNFITQNTNALLNGDQASVESQIEAMIAQAADQRGWSQYETERIRRDAKDAIDAIAKSKEAGVI